MALEASFIIRAIDRTTATMRRVTRNFEAMRAAQVRASKSFRFAADVRQAAAGLQVFSSVARRAVAAPVKEFEDFQAAMSGVRAVSRGITQNEFAALTKQAQELGSTTRFTATQAAEGMKFLGMAGFNAAEQMQAIPAALDLSTAAGTDLGRTTDILSDIMGAFNKEASETVAVSDQLAATITSSNTTLETLFETMSFAGPVAKAMNIPMEQVAALAGIIGSAGIKGSRAGTTLNAMITRLAGPTSKGAKALQRLGVEVNDVDGNLRPLPAILSEVAKATATMGTSARGKTIKDIFGIRALAGVSTLLAKVGGGEIQKFADDIKNSGGAAAEMARIMDDNAKGATIRLQSSISGLLTVIGKQLEPTLTSIKETLTSVVQAVTGFANRNPRLTKSLAVLAGVVAVVSTALTGILFTISALASAAGFAALASGASATAAALLAATGPIGLVALAIGAIVAAGILLWQNWEPISSKFLGMWERFTDASTATKVVITALLSPLLALVAPFISIGLAAKFVISNWENIGLFFVDMWNDIVEGIKTTIDWLGKIEIPEPLLNVIDFIAGRLGKLGGVAGLGVTVATKALDAVGGVAREAAFIAGGGEAGAADLRTSDFLARTNEASIGEGTLKIEIVNGQSRVVDMSSPAGISMEVGTDFGDMMAAADAGAL